MNESKTKTNQRAISPVILLGVFFVSSATLAFEINLTRLFSISQFYHFSFMIVSIALLGYGASGSFLAISPRFKNVKAETHLHWFALAVGAAILFSFFSVNWVPFDSYSMFIDYKQILILIFHFIALASPFFFSGIIAGMLISNHPYETGKIYAANMIGSGSGCVIALVSPIFLGLPGTVLLCAGIPAVTSILWTSIIQRENATSNHMHINISRIVASILILSIILGIATILINHTPPAFLDITISPYKSLSYSLQYPGAEISSQKWNSYSRIDIVQSPGIRSLPGISTGYQQQPPRENGLHIDGDQLSPIVKQYEKMDFAPYLPTAIGYLLRPNAETLLLEPRGGLEILTALAMGAGNVTAVEANPLIIEAAKHIYHASKVNKEARSGRNFLKQAAADYDIVVISLASSFHPIRSGAYSLSEDYTYTIEAFQDTLDTLKSDGILIVNRWLQNPPSESLRVFALGITALENSAIDPKYSIVAFRGYNMATLLIKNEAFSHEELTIIYAFIDLQGFDLIYSPVISQELINQHNILPDPIYWKTFSDFINTNSREQFYIDYEYDIRPPTDDKPYFSNYFKWTQINQIITEIGKYWQPFGGAGFLVIIVLLFIAIFLSGILILLPVWTSHRRFSGGNKPGQTNRAFLFSILTYFAMLGLAYLLVEIPMIQKYILYLDNPAYAIATVLFSLLIFSGLGSLFCNRLHTNYAFGALVLLLILTPTLVPYILNATIGVPLAARFVMTVIIIAPLGFLMGTPFPLGIQRLSNETQSNNLIPWIWAINGSMSVIAAILAAFLAISFGFRWVFIAGAICYGIAWISSRFIVRFSPTAHPG